MPAPDFLCIGAQKAGTTWLQENLSRHPDIWLPPPKELHYFDHPHPGLAARLFNRKKNHLRKARHHLAEKLVERLRDPGREQAYDELAWAYRYCLGRRSDAWYATLFPTLPGRLRGEVCPGYARIPEPRVADVARLMPQGRIVYLLRNPVERAWSSLSMHFRKGGDQLIDDVSEADVLRRFESPKTRGHAEYARYLASWEDISAPDRLFVGFFDDLAGDPRAFLASVLGFLGARADESVLPPDVGERRTPVARRSCPSPSPAPSPACLPEARAMEARFHNAHTRRWLEMTEAWAA
ncbi:MAG: sulfotransferase [Myxococcota bacterium]